MRRRSAPRQVALVSALVAGLVAGSCGSEGRAPRAGSTAGVDQTDALSGSLVVLAAASLTDPFTSIATAFEDAHPGVHVALTFDGSSKLASEIAEGVPGDVFASADEVTLAKLTDAGAASGRPVLFATNELQIAVAAGNPLGIGGLDDLLDDGVVLALCRPEVPCGSYAAQAFRRAGLAVPPAAREGSVTGVVTKVQLGEADAGIVYRTDVLAAKGLAGIDLPRSARVRAAYPASVLANASNPRAAAAFVAFLNSPEAQALLATAGFGRP